MYQRELRESSYRRFPSFRRAGMKARLEITRGGTVLHSAVYEIDDADGFGKACASAWSVLRERQLNDETSIGALMDHLDRSVLDQLSDATMTVTAVR
jgi:hypothetical protein